jgi:5'-AMP-activated protein kinase catalytic alpha subunit
MEHCCNGELFNYITSKTRLREEEACRLFQQLISGIEYLSELGIAHRDIKPENLLLDEQKNLKIVDFGLSNTY